VAVAGPESKSRLVKRLLLLVFAIAFPLAAAETTAIRWEPFEPAAGSAPLLAELGRLTVPLRRDAPTAGSAELAFVRLRMPGGRGGAPIVYLAGGPGTSGIGVARNPYAIPSLKRLAGIGDVILLDQRGIGASSPIPVCPPKPLPPHARFRPRTESMPRIVDETRACVAEWAAKGVDVRGFTVAESAADVEALRVGLGVPKVNLVAHSYGTHLALATIRAHPSSIERAALIATAGMNGRTRR